MSDATAPKAPIRMVREVNDAEYNEAAYLAANPDVSSAVRSGAFRSGWEHFNICGRREGRKARLPLENVTKESKLQRMLPLLRTDLPSKALPDHYDFLSDTLRAEFNIVDTDAISSNEYDENALALIERHAGGWVLDCGAGQRSTYYNNVVNFEIVAYDTTDVRGVAEVLPFVDGAFDAAISIAVLEHVKDPFASAREIARVVKPGGELYCCVPFLQPLHGYPHHYYNMTHQGHANLFSDSFEVERIDVIPSVLPIWALTWIVRSWADGLQGTDRKDFLDLRLGDLVGNPVEYLNTRFVRNSSREKNLELACATVLSGRRKG
jgi:SAM-dependent methyltransferase